jgi:tight adherence protein B
MTPALLLSALALLMLCAGGERGGGLKVLAAGGRLAAGPRATAGGRGLFRRVRRRMPAVALSGRAVLAICVAAAALAVAVAGPLGVAATAGVIALASAGHAARAARRRARSRAQAGEAVALLAAELAVGVPLPSAMDAAAEVAPMHAASIQASRDAMRAAGNAAAPLSSGGEPVLVATGHALRVATACGLAVTDVLERVLADAAAVDDARRAALTATAGPRASCHLLALLPVLGLGMGVSMGARPFDFLIGSPAGRVLCCAGVVLDVAGVLWARSIVQRAVPP